MKTYGIALSRVPYNSCENNSNFKTTHNILDFHSSCVTCTHKILPSMGPIATTKSPFPTIWRPKAAGSFSKDEYSDIVIVKLINAAPLKKPQITNQIIIMVQSVCSARTVRNRNRNYIDFKYFY